jgi:hypothetical protein
MSAGLPTKIRTSLVILYGSDCRLKVVACWQCRRTSRPKQKLGREKKAKRLTNTTPVLVNKNSWALAAVLDGWIVMVVVSVVVAV